MLRPADLSLQALVGGRLFEDVELLYSWAALRELLSILCSALRRTLSLRHGVLCPLREMPARLSLTLCCAKQTLRPSKASVHTVIAQFPSITSIDLSGAHPSCVCSASFTSCLLLYIRL